MAHALQLGRGPIGVVTQLIGGRKALVNWVEIEQDWATMKALVQSQWRELTQDDLAAIDGKREQLCQVLQRRLNMTEQAAEDAICAFEKDVRRPGAVK